MILRRVIEHVKAQNWTAIAIDFVIVVAGVFLGIQVANWNDARSNETIAAGHLSEIAEDLQAHLNFNEGLYGSALARIAAVDDIYDKAFGKELPQTIRLSTLSWDAPPTEPPSKDELGNIMGAVNLIRVTVSARDFYRLGLSVFDERPVEDIIALARADEGFAAYLRTTREWAIVHAGLLEDLRVEAETLLAAIRQELQRISRQPHD